MTTKCKRELPFVMIIVVVGILIWLSIPPPVESPVFAKAIGSSQSSFDPVIEGPINLVTDKKRNYFGDAAYNSLHDEFLVVWVTKQGDYSRDIWARRVSRDGKVLSLFNVANIAGDILERPYVAYSPIQDEYLIAYTNFYDGIDKSDIFARRVRWDGGWMSNVITISDKVDSQVTFDIAYNSRDDEYLVAYVNQRAGGLIDIYAQRVRASNGALLSGNFVASSAEAVRTYPSVAYHLNAYGNTGGYLFVYFYYHTSSHTTEVRMKTSPATLSGLSTNPEIQVCPTCLPDINVQAAAGEKGYLVTWWNQDNGYQVRGRRVGLDGSLKGDSTGFAISEFYPYLISNIDHDLDYSSGLGFLCLWYHEPPTSAFSEVYANLIPSGANEPTHLPFRITDAQIYVYSFTGACADLDCLVGYEWFYTDNNDLAAMFLRGKRNYLPLILR